MITAEEVSKMLAPVLKQLGEQKQLIDALQHLVNTSFAKACDKASSKMTYDDDLRNVKADMIEFNKRLDAIKEALATGRGVNRPATMLTKEDFAAVLPAKLESVSLAEIVELTEGKQ